MIHSGYGVYLVTGHGKYCARRDSAGDERAVSSYGWLYMGDPVEWSCAGLRPPVGGDPDPSWLFDTRELAEEALMTHGPVKDLGWSRYQLVVGGAGGRSYVIRLVGGRETHNLHRDGTWREHRPWNIPEGEFHRTLPAPSENRDDWYWPSLDAARDAHRRFLLGQLPQQTTPRDPSEGGKYLVSVPPDTRGGFLE